MDSGSMSNESLLALYAMMAQQESFRLSQNVKKGNRMRMAKGAYISTNAPYGYRLENKLPRIYEPEAKVVRRIFKECLSGRGCGEIGKGLINDKIPRKDGGGKWNHITILDILKNERYIGDMLFQKSYTTDDISYKKCMNDGELPQYYVKNTHQAIVTEWEFKLANNLLEKRSQTINVQPKDNYILSKMIKCGDCSTIYRRKLNSDKVYWVCRTYDNNRSLCNGHRILEDDIYQAFIRMYYILKTNNQEILKPMQIKLEKFNEIKEKSNIELVAINQKIAELHRQNHVMNGLMSNGILDSAIFISKSDEINKKIFNLKKQKTKLFSEEIEDGLLSKTEILIQTIEQGPRWSFTMEKVRLSRRFFRNMAMDGYINK